MIKCIVFSVVNPQYGAVPTGKPTPLTAGYRAQPTASALKKCIACSDKQAIARVNLNSPAATVFCCVCARACVCMCVCMLIVVGDVDCFFFFFLDAALQYLCVDCSQSKNGSRVKTKL
jgi:hypothetical protein